MNPGSLVLEATALPTEQQPLTTLQRDFSNENGETLTNAFLIFFSIRAKK